MKDRWATLAFILVLAIGATLVGRSLDSEAGSKEAEPQAAVVSEPEADEEAEAIPVVNADGSLRRPDDASAMSVDPPDSEDPGLAINEAEGMDDASFDESETLDRPVQPTVAGRIE
jgi:hypothetical protein